MPELPDVEVFRRMVQHGFAGDTVARVIVSDADILLGVTAATVQRRLKSSRLAATDRHGKYLFLAFDCGDVLVMHFGPAGTLRGVPANEPPPAYVRFQIDFAGGNRLAYVNRRRIGRVRLADSVASSVAQSRLGPDALDSALGQVEFGKILAGRRQPIKLLLMDQSRIAGIGNTYSDEILFQARIVPTAPAGQLDDDQIASLFGSIRRVLQTAIDLDPTTDDFRARLPSGYLLPHRYPGGHCPRCGTLLERIVLGGHTSTYCPHCQRRAQEAPATDRVDAVNAPSSGSG